MTDFLLRCPRRHGNANLLVRLLTTWLLGVYPYPSALIDPLHSRNLFLRSPKGMQPPLNAIACAYPPLQACVIDITSIDRFPSFRRPNPLRLLDHRTVSRGPHLRFSSSTYIY